MPSRDAPKELTPRPPSHQPYTLALESSCVACEDCSQRCCTRRGLRQKKKHKIFHRHRHPQRCYWNYETLPGWLWSTFLLACHARGSVPPRRTDIFIDTSKLVPHTSSYPSPSSLPSKHARNTRRSKTRTASGLCRDPNHKSAAHGGKIGGTTITRRSGGRFHRCNTRTTPCNAWSPPEPLQPS